MAKKVLQLIGSFNQGGSERQAVQLARLLKDDGRMQVLLATMRKEGPLLEEASAYGFDDVPEFRIGSFFSPGFINGVRRAAKFVRQNQIEVIHSHDFYTNVFGAAVAAASKVPKFVASKRETEGMRSGSQKFVEKIAFWKADAVLANSDAVRSHLIGLGVAREKIAVVHNGLDAERLAPKILERRKICDLLGLPQNDEATFITLVANLRHEVKNQLMFIRAAAEISDKHPDAHFVIAGEGELREGLERLAKDIGLEGRMHFIGRCEIVPELLSVSHACVLTSFNEGFPNAVLEYMAAGKPVVATDVGGVSEVVEDGVNGYLIESDDSVALAEKLLLLIEDPQLATSFGESGKEKVSKEFSTDRQVERTLELYGV